MRRRRCRAKKSLILPKQKEPITKKPDLPIVPKRRRRCRAKKSLILPKNPAYPYCPKRDLLTRRQGTREHAPQQHRTNITHYRTNNIRHDTPATPRGHAPQQHRTNITHYPRLLRLGAPRDEARANNMIHDRGVAGVSGLILLVRSCVILVRY